MTIDDIELPPRPTGVNAPSTGPIDVGALPRTLFHDRRWQQAVEQSFGLAIKQFVPKAEPTGRGHYSVVSDIRGERVICTPFSDFCDPLMGEEGWAEFAEHLRSYNLPVTVRPFRNQAVIADTSFQRRSELLWHGIGLDDGFDPFWEGLKSKMRTKIRRSRKEMTFRTSSSLADVELFHAMHVDLRKSKYGLLAQPFEFFANLHESFGDDMVVLLAEYEGDPVAGMVYFECDGVWYYKFGASLPCLSLIHI